jgi:hypothetical protein
MNIEQLGEYLYTRGVPEESIHLLLDQGLNGESWMQMLTTTQSEGSAAVEEIWKEIGVDRRLTKSRLMGDSQAAQESYQKRKFRQDMTDSEENEKLKSAQKGNSPGPGRTPGRDSPEPDGKHRNRICAKVHYAPKIPSYDVTKDMDSGVDLLQVFGKTLATWTEPFSTSLADAMKNIMKRIDLPELKVIFSGLDTEARQLDTELGGHLFATAPKAAQDELFEDSKRELEGRTSALKVIWSWMELVDSNSKTRMASAIARWLTRKPTQRAQDLHADLQQFQRDMGTMS